MEIVMIGKMHFGKKGINKKILEILEKEKPDIICVEIGNLDFKKLKKKYELTKEILSKYIKPLVSDEVFKFILMIYDKSGDDMIEIPLQYSKNHDVKIYRIDSTKLMINKIKELNKQIKLINKIEELKDNIINELENGYKELKKSIKKIIDQIKNDEEEVLEGFEDLIGRRDKIMKTKLKNIVKNNPGKKIVTINGMLHLVKDSKGRTFYSKIKKDSFFNDFKIKRIFLS